MCFFRCVGKPRKIEIVQCDIDSALQCQINTFDHIGKARAYDPDDVSLKSDSWMYLPDYDEYWYRALGHWWHARTTQEPSQRLLAYDQALQAWSAYLRRAVPTDPWAALAELRQRQCRREHRRALDESRR